MHEKDFRITPSAITVSMNNLVGCENDTTTVFDASRHDSPLSTVVDDDFISIDDLDTECILIG